MYFNFTQEKWGLSDFEISRYLVRNTLVKTEPKDEVLFRKIEKLKSENKDFTLYLLQFENPSTDLQNSIFSNVLQKVNFAEVSNQETSKTPAFQVSQKSRSFTELNVWKFALAACFVILVGIFWLPKIKNESEILYKGKDHFLAVFKNDIVALNGIVKVSDKDTLLVYPKNLKGYFLILFKDDEKVPRPYYHSAQNAVFKDDASHEIPLLAIELMGDFKKEVIWFFYSAEPFSYKQAVQSVVQPNDHKGIDVDSLVLVNDPEE